MNLAFEERLKRDPRWAMGEGSIFFEGQGAVQETLHKITRRLGELGIAYAVVGGMALFAHGFRRFTEDVDLLVTSEDLRRIHDQLEGLGYLPPFEGSKNLRDTNTGVKIEFIVTGGYPGDGKPKPVAFPEPAAVALEMDGMWVANLATVMELKIASGMTSPARMKDLGDAQELIKILRLDSSYADKLNPYVRLKYAELWSGANPAEKRYIRSAVDVTSALLQAMKLDGVALDAKRGILITNDRSLADKYDMHDESEFMN